jgi:glycosyltransferase involved in cell wall biosynthesis
METVDPRVSIVIPVYNGSNYLRRAIGSSLHQSYRNIEVIVVNDGSDDGGLTRDIALSYGDRISYLEQENGGVATALNAGIRGMTGEYFSWLSHDDEYYEHKIATQIEHLRRYRTLHSGAQPILFSDYAVIDEESRVARTVRFDHEYLSRKPLYALLRGCLHGCTLLIPKEAFHRCGMFDPALKTTQDYDMWNRLIAVYPFVHIPMRLVKSRAHPAQGSRVMPDRLVEESALWIRMMEDRTLREKCELESSEYGYYRAMHGFLRDSSCTRACEHARVKKMEAESGITGIDHGKSLNPLEIVTAAWRIFRSGTHEGIRGRGREKLRRMRFKNHRLLVNIYEWMLYKTVVLIDYCKRINSRNHRT